MTRYLSYQIKLLLFSLHCSLRISSNIHYTTRSRLRWVFSLVTGCLRPYTVCRQWQKRKNQQKVQQLLKQLRALDLVLGIDDYITTLWSRQVVTNASSHIYFLCNSISLCPSFRERMGSACCIHVNCDIYTEFRYEWGDESRSNGAVCDSMWETCQ